MTAEASVRLQPDSARHTWGHFIEDVAARHGARAVIRFEGRDFTAVQLLADARALAKGLAAQGVGKGTRVALHMANRPEFAVASFAVAMLGAVLVPVNTFATPDEREYILRHSDSALLLFQRQLLKHDFLAELLAMFPGLANDGPLYDARVPQLRRAFCLGLDAPGSSGPDSSSGSGLDSSSGSRMDSGDSSAPGTGSAVQPWRSLIDSGASVPDALLDALIAEVHPADDGLIIYTSGSTARPKGVLHRQRAATMQSWLIADELRYSPADRVFTTYPFFWSAGICMALGATLAAGATLLLQETFEPGAALQLLADERATATQAWPHQVKAMAEHPLYPALDLSRIDKEVYRLNPDIPPEQDLWGTQGSFGMTETFTFAANVPADAPAAIRHETSGRPRPGLDIRIVDPASGAVLPVGAPGEIAVKGLTLMRGYYKVAPEDSFDADGYFHTQDGGHLDAQGYVHWDGRLSNLIKTGGANVSPIEIDEALFGFPGLRAAVTFGAPHPTLGEVVVLCAVAITGESLDSDALLAFLKPKLAAYKLPRAIVLFSEDELSFTGTQKIQTTALTAKALARLRADAVEIAGVNYAEFLVDGPA